MILIAGLGNPGQDYESNRHNVGFLMLDHLQSSWNFPPFVKKYKGEFTSGMVHGFKVGLLKPLTYMNLSGQSVGAAMRYFNVPLGDVIVVHDELDIAFGKTKIKIGGGSGGHNGIKNITALVGQDTMRLRLGIGRPQGSIPVEKFVLQNFSSHQRSQLDSWFRAIDAASAHLLEGESSRFLNELNHSFNGVPEPSGS